MERFHIIDDAAVIVRNKGVYRQLKVFRRGAGVYAQYGGGFIRLYDKGATGVPTVSWDEIDLGEDLSTIPDVHGRLALVGPLQQIEGASK